MSEITPSSTLSRGKRGGKNFLDLVVSAICGMLAVLAFAPFELWLLLAPCLGVLFHLVFRCSSPRQSFSRGYLFGLGFFGAGVYWVYFSLHLFGDAIAPLAALGTFLFVALLAFFPAFFAVGAYKLKGDQSPQPDVAGIQKSAVKRKSRTFWFLLLAPALWVLFEWIRSWIFTGFPWLSIGYATLHSPIAYYAPVGGVFLNSLMFAFCAGATGLLCTMGFARNFQRLASLASVALIAAVMSGGILLERVQWTTVAGEPVSVTMVQGNIQQELKFVPNLLQDSLDTYASMSDTGADLIIWPESAIPAFFSDVQGWIDSFVEHASSRGSTVISGGFLANEDFSEYYNSIKVLGGNEQQSYTKRHLVPFGEFMPFRSLLSILSRYIMIPMSDLTAGRGPVQPIEVNGVYYGMSICYEDAFGEEMKAQLPLANVLINVSNDAWFGDSTAPHQHQEIAAMRALEFQRPMLRVTNTGITSMISRHGKILVQGPQHEVVAIDVDVVPRAGATLFVTVGNWLAVGLALLILIWRWLVIRFR